MPASLTTSIASAASTVLLSTKSSTLSSLSSFLNSVRKRVLGSPTLFSKLPGFQIDWLNCKEIGREVMKYLKQENQKSTIEEELLYLLSQFSMSKICNALCVTITKLDLVASTDMDELPSRKQKLIEFFSKLIYNHMSILENSVKSAERYA